MKAVLDRYILTECAPTLGLSLAVFTFVLIMQRMLQLSDLVVAKGVPLLVVLRLLALALPAVLPLLLPLSLLLAVLLAMGRLSADGEVVAMRACGVSLARNLRPVALLSVAVLALTAAVSLWLQPLAAHSFEQAVFDAVRNRISATVHTGTFTDLTDGVTLYAEGLDERSGAMDNLFLFLDRGTTRGAWVLARKGIVREARGALELDLKGGEVHQYLGRGKPYRRLAFDAYRLRIPIPTVAGEAPEAEEKPSLELLDRIARGQATRRERLELHRRLAIPLSCLVFGLLGASLGVHHTRAGRSRAITVCLAVVLLYYALMMGARAMALAGKGPLSPEAASWLPNVALGALAVYAYARKSREAPLPLEEALGRALGRLRAALVRRFGTGVTP
jgi:lipopolysaccharide export system permease protein